MVTRVRSRSVFSLVTILVTLAALSSDSHSVAAGAGGPLEAAQSSETGTLLLAPEDTSLNLNAVNYSAQPLLMAYTWPDNKVANTILLKFDLSALPAGATVEQAVLNFALVESDTTADATYTMTAHKQVGINSVVAAATGYTADGVRPWTPSACCYNGVPLAQNNLSTPYAVRAVSKTPGFKAWTITTMVQEWVADPASNFGLVLNADAAALGDRYRFFASMEHPDTTLRPFLRVTFAAADATAPSVTITAPLPGTVSGTVSVAASATDNVGVAGVQFHVDGVPLGAELTSAPYTRNWDTTAFSDGNHALTAVARDWAGNSGVSAEVSVTVTNAIVVLSPQDTSLNTNATNYSTSTLLTTYTWPDFKVSNAVLMKFDLSALPPGAFVMDATLRLALVQADGTADATYTVAAHKVLGKNPVITAATGYTANGVTNWTPAACCPVPLAQADISPSYDQQAIDKALGFKSWTITTMVQEWRANPATNFGLLLNSDASKARDRYRSFASMEHTDASLRPYLKLTYSSTTDRTAPSVAITAPAPGATVSGTVVVTANASDNVGVVGVQFKLDGNNLGAEDTTTPYSASWNTITAVNGSHALTAVARDAAGNTTTSAAVGATAANDTTSPSVSITGPAAGATVSGTATVAANASDNVGVVGVRFTVDGVTLGTEDTTAPYSRPWTTTTATNGAHTLTAVARDAAGNTRTSVSVAVTVSNDAVQPTVAITAPAGGATMSATTTVTASASDNVGVVGVQFKLDGANLGAEDTASPYSLSWNTTATSNGSHALTAVARDAAGNQRTSAAVTVTVSNVTPPPPGNGLAALYPGDAGIENHPNVIFVERFEEPTLNDLFVRWSDTLNGAAMSLTPDVPPGSPGARSLNIPWAGGGSNNGGHLFKQLSPGVDDTLYVRYYIKYPTSGKFHHTGIWMGGNNPSLSWPNPQAGIKPVGHDRFIAGAEQNTLTMGFDHYNYWMNMRPDASGTHWGNFLLNNPNVDAAAGQWTCVEHMVKLNNPTTAFNGEHAIWLNGVKVSHLGQGFPNGSWSGGRFTQNPSGTPFEGFRWRSSTSLNLNWIWLQNYSPDDPAGFNGNMYFDHVVAARSYIGCLASSGSSDVTSPTVSGTAPAVGATVSGSTVTVSATAADNVGVTGVQFKLDGANLGAQDTTSPFSISWNTTTGANGLRTLTAVARDAAGNTTTSAGRAVTVSNTTTPPPPPPSGGWANEPAGMTLRTDWGLDQAIPTGGDVSIPGSPGWKVVQNASPGSSRGWAARVTDSSAPFSPSNVYDFVYPSGLSEGEAPATVYYAGLGATDLYAGFWWKASSPFDMGPNGNKIAFMFNGGGGAGGQQFLILYPDQRLRVLPEYPGDYQWRTPNINATVVTLGVWHKIEWYASKNGTLKWWLDGLLQGSYTNATNSYNFDMFQFSPTWGGNSGATKNQTDHYWFDHARLSTR